MRKSTTAAQALVVKGRVPPKVPVKTASGVTVQSARLAVSAKSKRMATNAASVKLKQGTYSVKTAVKHSYMFKG